MSNYLSKWVAALLLAGACSPMMGQTLTNGATLRVTGGAVMTVSGGVTNSSPAILVNQSEIKVGGDFANDGNLVGTGKYRFNGSSLQRISGSTNPSFFFDLEMANTRGTVLEQNITVTNSLEFTSGNLDLNGNTIELLPRARFIGESNGSRAFGTSGEIRTRRTLSSPVGNIAGLGMEFLSSDNYGSTLIVRKHAAQSIGSGSSITRSFEITPTNNTNLNTRFRMYFLAPELNGQIASGLQMYERDNGSAPWRRLNSTVNVANRYVEVSGLSSLGQYTLSADGTVSVADQLPKLSVQYFPNPVGSSEVLSLTGLDAGSYTLRLLDIRGKVALNQQVTARSKAEQQDVHLPQLAAGVYTFQLISPDYQPTTGKLVIYSH
ncbi:MAG: T9SS type A sorting domain-containing protein [Bacteroidota bacterium]